MTPFPSPRRARLLAEDGFTMIIAIGVMFVTSLLLVAAFTATNNDIHLSRVDTTQKQAYYAALAGVQQYEYKLQADPNYWQTCEGPKNTVPEESGERYEVQILPASTSPGGAACSVSDPFNTAIEAEGSLANTFRIKSTGYAGPEKRSLVATFKVTGFLNFIYFTNFETLDPALYSDATLAANCQGKYYSAWKGKYECENIQFTNGDSVYGPMHTNDTADVGGAASFGREGNTPPDTVEMNGGTYGGASGCASSAKYYTATKCYIKGASLIPPESDTSLVAYTESANEFFGVTKLVLNGSANTIGVTYFTKAGVETKETISWPKNGLLYVQHLGACAYKYEYANSDTAAEATEEKGCGNVYVRGTYSKSLTIAGENDVIVNGEIYPTSVEGKLGAEPSGTAVLGLIASHYVRVYHPCSGGKDGAGTLTNPWIYAAILSTAHSFIVDNFRCGSELGKLHVFGAIAQDYRGAVGTTGGTGYIKDYKYDDRLATDEPPYFLQPLKAGWKVIRQTAPTAG
jgi:hypothetical protein